MIVRPSGANRANVIEPRLNVSGSNARSRCHGRRAAGDRTNAAQPAATSTAATATSRSQRLRPGDGASSHDLAGEARQRFDVERDVARRLEALLRVLLEAVEDDALERGRQRLGPSPAGAGPP